MALRQRLTMSNESLTAAGRSGGPLFLFLTVLLLLMPQTAAAQSIPDTEPPAFDIQYPRDWIAGSMTSIDVYYSDGGSGVNTGTLAVILDGNDITAACNVFPNHVWCNSGNMVGDTHLLEVSIDDNTGNRGTVTKTFGRDATIPVITSITPNNTWSNTADPVVTVVVTDNEAGVIASSLQLRWGRDGVTPVAGCTITAYSPYSAGISCPLADLADGVYEFGFHADTIAWSTTWNLGPILKVDTRAPVISNVAPAGWVGQGVYSIAADYADAAPGAVSSIVASIDGGPPLQYCSFYSGHLSCKYISGLTEGAHTLTIVARDAAGNSSTTTTSFGIDLTPPSITNITPGGLVGGGPVTLGADLSDAGSGIDATTAVVRLDGSTLAGCGVSGGHVSCPAGQPGPGPHVIQVTVADGVGRSVTASGSFQVESNRPPTVAAGGDLTVEEGTPAARVITAADPDGDSVTLTASRGQVVPDGSGWAWSYTPADGPADSGPVTITAADGHGGTAAAIFNLTVTNVAPTVGTVTAPIDPQLNGVTVSAAAPFADAGVLDTHTAIWDWGDGTTSAATVVEAGGSGAASGTHAYTGAGVYTVTLTVTDDDGASQSRDFHYLVVYDPDAGFVTGGGWIDSPAGACSYDPGLTGTASFGFVSRYMKGANVPAGQTEFQFKAGGLNFHSTGYEWLVIAGSQARYKGSGTINGGGDYGFMLSAVDGSKNGGADRFRIKIWDKSTGALVYDNDLGAPDEADPVTALGGGSIVIHKE